MISIVSIASLLNRGLRADIFYAEGEFHVDLYTLPDSLVKMLWDFVSKEGRV